MPCEERMARYDWDTVIRIVSLDRTEPLLAPELELYAANAQRLRAAALAFQETAGSGS